MAQTVERSAAAKPSSDWTVQAADTIESVVGGIRDKTTIPITTVARALVYGLVAGALGLAALVLVAVGLVRFAVVYVGDIGWFSHNAGRPVWAAEALVGLPFVLGGLFFWRKRRPADDKR
jgi:hypothetical protein